MKYFLLSLLLLFSFFCCKKQCDKSLRVGEIVQIPVEFVGFSLAEINSIYVYRIDKSNVTLIDTFSMREILWAHEARTFNEIITDNTPSSNSRHFGRYDSYFDNCNLIFNWQTDKDTLSDFKIKKSKEESNDCHSDDPNVKINQFSFFHKGKSISKNESIRITK
ncbi:MAG: hypothetical protein Q8M15_04330 [Bacteroidota bacterium]|nr:hypothetical protein [Bacteroidota bacterium]